jgi:hypothetical protein
MFTRRFFVFVYFSNEKSYINETNNSEISVDLHLINDRPLLLRNGVASICTIIFIDIVFHRQKRISNNKYLLSDWEFCDSSYSTSSILRILCGIFSDETTTIGTERFVCISDASWLRKWTNMRTISTRKKNLWLNLIRAVQSSQKLKWLR